MPENPYFPNQPQPSSLQELLRAMGQSVPTSAYQLSQQHQQVPNPLLRPVSLQKKRQYFLKQEIRLDSIHFEECRFDECVIKVLTPNIKLTKCVFGPGNQLQLGDQLIPLAKLLAVFNQFPENWKPTIGQAGVNLFTVTI